MDSIDEELNDLIDYDAARVIAVSALSGTIGTLWQVLGGGYEDESLVSDRLGHRCCIAEQIIAEALGFVGTGDV